MGNRGDQDTVYCFDAASGREIWKHTYACKLEPKYYEGGPSATPTIDGDRVFTLSKQGHSFCLDAATGKVLWSKNLNEELGLKIPSWGFASSVLVQGNALYLNVGARGTALDKGRKDHITKVREYGLFEQPYKHAPQTVVDLWPEGAVRAALFGGAVLESINWPRDSAEH